MSIVMSIVLLLHTQSFFVFASSSITKDTATDFNQGTLSSTTVSGSGASAVIQLSLSATGPNSTQYRRVITIDNTGNSNTLTDYQISLTLDTASLITAGKMKADCGDIRINDSDDSTQITNYWVENCNNAATLVWVKVPSITASSSKTIYLYYGNAAATGLSSTTNTFLTDLSGVVGAWPLEAASGSTAVDNSGNGNDGTIAGTSVVAGKFTNARSFSTSSDSITIPTDKQTGFPYGTNDRTVCAWADISGAISGSWGFIYSMGDNTNTHSFNIGRFDTSLDLNGWGYDLESANFWTTNNEWHYICGTFTGTTAKVYADGTLKNTDTVSPINVTSNLPAYIGTGPNSSTAFTWLGAIEQVTLFSQALTQTQINTLASGYGYTTTNYPGHILARSFSSPEPSTSVGSEVQLLSASGTWESPSDSNVIDLGAASNNWGDGSTGSSTAFSASIAQMSSNQTMQFQMRTATTAVGLASASYVTLGTANTGTTFTQTKSQLDTLGITAQQFVQVKLTFAQSTQTSPQLDSFTITYTTNTPTPTPTPNPTPTPSSSSGGSSSSSSSSSPQSPNVHAGWSNIVMAGPSFIGQQNFITGSGEASGAMTFISNSATLDDVFISITKQDISELPANNIPFPWMQGYNTAGDIFNFQATAAFNGYPITSFMQPVTIVIPYNPLLLYGHDTSQLQIAMYNATTRRWQLVPHAILNPFNHTLATTVTGFSYFTVVYSSGGNAPLISNIAASSASGFIQPTRTTVPLITPLITPKPLVASPSVSQSSSKHCFLFLCW